MLNRVKIDSEVLEKNSFIYFSIGLLWAKFVWNWPSGLKENIQNVKVYRRKNGQTDDEQNVIRKPSFLLFNG